MIEYIDEIHCYLYDGVIIPSVSQILQEKLFKDKYKNVPKWILEKKANYGTQVHKSIEMYEINLKTMCKEEAFDVTVIALNLNIIQQESLKQYIKLKEQYNFKVVEQEVIICYKGKYAGRFDMIIEMDNKLHLVDIKTTYELDREYVSWQLSMYDLGCDKEIENYYVLWLPKKKIGKFERINKKEKDEIGKIIQGEENGI